MSFMSKEQIIQEFNNKGLAEYDANPLNETVPVGEFFDFEAIEKHVDTYRPTFYFKKTIPSEIDYRNYDSPVESQDNGKCTAWALSHCMGLMLNKKSEEKRYDLSEWHTWSKYGRYSCESAIAALSKKENRVCDESYWPQHGTRKVGIEQNKHAWVSKQRYIGNNIELMKEALAAGHIVYLGMTVPSDMSAGRAVIRPDSRATSGGHALAIVGYYTDPNVPGGIVAILKNSWGTRTGDKGYQYLPIQAYADRKDCYIMLWEIAEVSSQVGIPAPQKICTKWKSKWYAPWKKTCVEWKEV